MTVGTLLAALDATEAMNHKLIDALASAQRRAGRAEGERDDWKGGCDSMAEQLDALADALQAAEATLGAARQEALEEAATMLEARARPRDMLGWDADLAAAEAVRALARRRAGGTEASDG